MSTFKLKESVSNKLDEQRELFLWKFKDVSRADVTEQFEGFLKHDVSKTGELDEHEALMFLEHRGLAHTATEFRTLMSSIDKNKERDCLNSSR